VSLPAHWTGKNFACHQLASQAKGDYYLFLDADVRISGTLIERVLEFLVEQDLALLSIFPVQIMETRGAKISVPLMNWILLSLLPMPFIRRSRRPSLAAANGQFMLFPSEIYDRFKPHQVFRGNSVEDMAIIRFLKKHGYPVETFLGSDDISCRMYDRLGPAIEGFTKNIFLFFGNSILITVLYATLITLAPVFIILYLPVYAWIIYFGLILMMRINISLASRQPVFQNLFYLVPQQIVLLLIIGKAIYNRIFGKLVWKGRNILRT
jgi:glycosyltransferase involved in cell wall biosynthesis